VLAQHQAKAPGSASHSGAGREQFEDVGRPADIAVEPSAAEPPVPTSAPEVPIPKTGADTAETRAEATAGQTFESGANPPLRKPHEPASLTAEAASTKTPLPPGSLSVLVAEDDPINNKIIQKRQRRLAIKSV
jgi:CheY-like chemotaxis protein